MSYLRSGLPWIAFAALAAVNWPVGAIAALLIAIAVVAYERHTGAAWDGLVLQASAAGFFVIVAAIALASPHSWLAPYSGAGAQLWLALVSWIGVAAHKPFTLGIAKHGVPEQVWHQPSFVKVNMNISAFWAASFTVTGVVIAAIIAVTANSGLAGLVQILGLIVPVAFTFSYKKHAHAKAAAHAAALSAQPA